MKALIASIVCLAVGLAIGFFVGYRYCNWHGTNEAEDQMIQMMESSDRLAAARGLRAIELIEAGNTNQAIEMFSFPIADFYAEYAYAGTNDERTLKLRAQIEQFAKTNQVVADQIRASTNAFFQLPPMWPNTMPENNFK
jgi:hypothetical protein